MDIRASFPHQNRHTLSIPNSRNSSFKVIHLISPVASDAQGLASIQAAASSFAVQTGTAPVHAKDEIESVIAALAPSAGIIAIPDLFNTINRDLIVAAAARSRVPAIYFFRSFADSGGLVSYGPDFAPQ